MGNAVDVLHRKKIEERQKQAEKEREIYQACISWNIKQEERKKKEILDKREKAWKQQEMARMNRDKELMDRYLKNIEREKKAEHKEFKHRQEELIKRKRETTSLSDRRMRVKEDHIKKERQIIARNIESIERQSQKSVKAMRSRVKSLTQKQTEDRKKFLHKRKIEEQDRKKELENNKRRIRMIEKKIVQEKVAWQEKLLAARRINSEKKVSARKLWDIGRKTVERKKQQLVEQKQKEEKTMLEIDQSRKSSTPRDQSLSSNKTRSKNMSVVQSTLSTVEEEEPAILNIGKKKLVPRVNEKTGKATNVKVMDGKIGRKSGQHSFQRLYVPQYAHGKAGNQITRSSIVRSKMSKQSTAESELEVSEPNSSRSTEQNKSSVKSSTIVSRDRNRNNTESRYLNPRNYQSNLLAGSHVQRKTVTGSSSSSPRTVKYKESTSTRDADKQVNVTGSGISPPRTTNKNSLTLDNQNQSKTTTEAIPQSIINNEPAKNESEISETPKTLQDKKNDISFKTGSALLSKNVHIKTRFQQNHGIVGNGDQLQNRKSIKAIPNSTLHDRQLPKQPEVEEIIGIQPLSYSSNKTPRKEVKLNSKTTTESTDEHTPKTQGLQTNKPDKNMVTEELNDNPKQSKRLVLRNEDFRFEFTSAQDTDYKANERQTNSLRFKELKGTDTDKENEPENKPTKITKATSQNEAVFSLPARRQDQQGSGIGIAKNRITPRKDLKSFFDSLKTTSRTNRSRDFEDKKSMNISDDVKNTTTMSNRSSMDVVSVAVPGEKKKNETDKFSGERKPKITVPLKARAKLSERTDNKPTLVIVDQRITDVQRRIDRLVKANTNDIPVV